MYFINKENDIRFCQFTKNKLNRSKWVNEQLIWIWTLDKAFSITINSIKMEPVFHYAVFNSKIKRERKKTVSFKVLTYTYTWTCFFWRDIKRVIAKHCIYFNKNKMLRNFICYISTKNGSKFIWKMPCWKYEEWLIYISYSLLFCLVGATLFHSHMYKVIFCFSFFIGEKKSIYRVKLLHETDFFNKN